MAMVESFTLTGRKIVAGKASGEAIVTREAISFNGGVDNMTGIVTEPGHELEGVNIAGKILVFKTGKGSTGGSYKIYDMVSRGTAPLGFVQSSPEGVTTIGAIIGSIPAVAKLDRDPTLAIATGDTVEIDADAGTVVVTPKTAGRPLPPLIEDNLPKKEAPMTTMTPLDRLARQDSNTISDALDFLGLPGATYGLRPLWDCPKIVGRASTIQLGPKTGSAPTVHLISPVIAAVTTDDRVLVIAGGLEGISCWGDILANASRAKQIRGSVIDGLSRDIEGSESIGYPVFGRGITMISARNRVIQVASGTPVQMAGVTVNEDDYVIADRCGTVFVPAGRIDEVLDLAERIAKRQDGMVAAVRAGRSVEEVMHDKEFEAIKVAKT